MIWGQVGVTVGPLPDNATMADCLAAASNRVAAINESFAKQSVFRQGGKLVWRSDVKVGCGSFADRPAGGTTLESAALEIPQ
jgi:hypothetical protein